MPQGPRTSRLSHGISITLRGPFGTVRGTALWVDRDGMGLSLDTAVDEGLNAIAHLELPDRTLVTRVRIAGPLTDDNRDGRVLLRATHLSPPHGLLSEIRASQISQSPTAVESQITSVVEPTVAEDGTRPGDAPAPARPRISSPLDHSSPSDDQPDPRRRRRGRRLISRALARSHGAHHAPPAHRPQRPPRPPPTDGAVTAIVSPGDPDSLLVRLPATRLLSRSLQLEDSVVRLQIAPLPGSAIGTRYLIVLQLPDSTFVEFESSLHQQDSTTTTLLSGPLGPHITDPLRRAIADAEE